jgi:hypothetical protein
MQKLNHSYLKVSMLIDKYPAVKKRQVENIFSIQI